MFVVCVAVGQQSFVAVIASYASSQDTAVKHAQQVTSMSAGLFVLVLQVYYYLAVPYQITDQLSVQVSRQSSC